jgi:DNA adenine methylase
MKKRPAKFFDVPMLRYVGAKWQLADWITSFFPDHDCYVEPYSGSAAIFLRKSPSKIEVLNDISDDVVNFYQVLRDRTDEFVRAIELTPYSRREYTLSYEQAEDAFERARRFYIRCWMGFGASDGVRTGWRFQKNVNRGTNIPNEWSRTKGLWFAAHELKHAIIESRPAVQVIQQYDTPRSFFYIDPPYVLKSRSGGVGRKRYTFEMSDADHRQLAVALNNIQGTAIVSGYASALYDELFAGWKTYSKTTTTNGSGQAEECIWIHPRIEIKQPETLPEARMLWDVMP